MRYIMRRVAWFIAGWLVLTAAGYGFAQAPPGEVPIVVGGPSTTIGDVLTGRESLAVFAGGSGGVRTMDVPSTGSATAGEALLLAPATFDPSTVDGGPTRVDVVRQVSVLAVGPGGDAGELVAVPRAGVGRMTRSPAS